MTKKKLRDATPEPRVDPLFKSVGDLLRLSAAMMVLAEQSTQRMTAAQLLFFTLTAAADLAGKRPTYTEIKEAAGGIINKSLHSTYKVLLPPSRSYPDGLGWLEQEVNRDDTRQKFLKLTPKGREVLRVAVEALKGE